MKKSITLISLITILFALVFSLAGCSGSDTRDGMQLVAGGESLGYYFYAPEEWTPSSVGEIKAAYISRVDPTSVSFAEVKTFAKMPLITATMILSTRKIAKIFFPLAPSPRNTPILCFFEAMLTAM